MEDPSYSVSTNNNSKNPETKISISQRWMIRESWAVVKSLVSPKGFGGFASTKKDIGAPVATKNDHHDWEDKITDEDPGMKALEEIETQFTLSKIFYQHLFTKNPQMRQIFWRFNLFQSLEKIVSVLNPDVDLNETLKALAERHRGRGIVNTDYDLIRNTFHWAFHQLKEIESSVADAWVAGWDM